MYEASNRSSFGQMWIRTFQNRVQRCSLGLLFRLWGVWGWTSSRFVIFNVNFFVNIFNLNFFETKITNLPTSPSRRYPHDHNNQRRKLEGRKKKKKLRQYPTQAVWSAWIVIVFVRTFHTCLCLYWNYLNKSDLSQLPSLPVVQFRGPVTRIVLWAEVPGESRWSGCVGQFLINAISLMLNLIQQTSEDDLEDNTKN